MQLVRKLKKPSTLLIGLNILIFGFDFGLIWYLSKQGSGAETIEVALAPLFLLVPIILVIDVVVLIIYIRKQQSTTAKKQIALLAVALIIGLFAWVAWMNYSQRHVSRNQAIKLVSECKVNYLYSPGSEDQSVELWVGNTLERSNASNWPAIRQAAVQAIATNCPLLVSPGLPGINNQPNFNL